MASTVFKNWVSVHRFSVQRLRVAFFIEDDRIIRKILTHLRVRATISSQFLVLRRLSGKARKRRNIRHIPSFRNAARRDASALKM